MPALDTEAIRAAAARFATPKTYGNFVNGQWCDARGGRLLNLINPATRDVVGRIQRSVAADVEPAVRAGVPLVVEYPTRAAATGAPRHRRQVAPAPSRLRGARVAEQR